MFQADQGHWSSWALGKKQGFVKQFSWGDMIHWRKGGLKDVPPLNPRRSRYRWNVTCHVWWTGISWPCTFVGISVWIYVIIFIAYINGNCKVIIECLCRPRNLKGEAYLLMWGFWDLLILFVCMYVCISYAWNLMLMDARERLRSAKTGVTILSPRSVRGYVVVSDQAWALGKSNKYSQPLNHLSFPANVFSIGLFKCSRILTVEPTWWLRR